jgi:class 3 adenylate cyclase
VNFTEAVGAVLRRFEATVGYFAGDSVMAYYNDPLPCPAPEARAVETAVALRAAMEDPISRWRRLGHDLGLGIGISAGYATLGMVGFEGRYEYTPLGSVVNMAARLCGEAKAEQILVSPRISAAVEELFPLEPAGDLVLKGISKPTTVHNVASLEET